jgi:hypothetical protein
MRRKNIKSIPRPLGDILFAILKKRGLASKIEENKILKLWPMAVGDKINLQTKADAFRNGTLFVKTTSSIWVQQLHFIKEEIIYKLNEIAGKIILKDIRFSVGHTLPNEKKQDDSDENYFLNERDKKMIDNCANSLADQELANIFQRVMEGEINRRRRLEAQKARGK